MASLPAAPSGYRPDVTSAPRAGALEGYRSSTYDDGVASDGTVRPHARAVMEAVLEHDLEALGAGVRDQCAAWGIRFASVDGDENWHLDPVPRVIAGDDWAHLEAGLVQRVRALNAFVADAYGERRIVAEGVLPQRVFDTMENFEPELDGFGPADGVWIGIAGLDVVRDDTGKWLVLEDNVRTPSGVAYWVAAREAILSRLDVPGGALPRPLDGVEVALRRVIGGDHAVVLTDGPGNAAHWEHQWIAERLELPLAEPGDLQVDGDRLLHGGSPVDALYRRTNADRIDTDVGGLLHPAWRAGTLKLTNCFGNGVADDKLAHAHVPEMIGFYLGEEPVLEQVETFDLGEPHTLERALDVFDELVIKDRGSYGGLGVVICPHARQADVEALRERVRAAPEEYVAQRLVGLSTHPTVMDGTLVPRHVDLRPFVLMTAPDQLEVLPGGITRVALDEGALVVNSSQNGGAKDTWVLR